MSGADARPLHPSQVWVWTVGWGLAATLTVAVLVAVDVAARAVVDADPPWPAGVPAAAVAVVLALAVWRLPRMAYDRWRYELADAALELRRGVWVEARTLIPYFRVQHIDITRSPIERALGLSQLVVRTAAATTDATIPGIAAADAESLRDVILSRTGRGDAV